MDKSEMRPTPFALARPNSQRWLISALLALLTFAVYWPATSNGFINYDDEIHVTSNSHVKGGLTREGLKWGLFNSLNGNWHPVTTWSHMLDCQLFGLNPRGHHLTSVLLHALNAALLFELLRLMTGATWRSLLVAILFALHPLRVESVAWVAERKDVLSGFFFMVTLLAYRKYVERQRIGLGSEDRAQKTEDRGRRSEIGDRTLPRPDAHTLPYVLSLLAFALGVMSKPMLVTLPFVMLLLDYWPLERFKSNSAWRLVKEKIPFFVLAVGASILTFLVQKSADAMEASVKLALNDRTGNALVSYYRYLGKLFWPADLAVFYPHPGHWPIEKVLLAGGLLLVISAIAFAQRRVPFLLVGWLWFIGMLVPVIGLVQVGDQAMADRYTYLPTIGVLIALVWGAHALTKSRPNQEIALWATASAALSCCLVLTRQQLSYWRNSETLFQHALEVTSNNYLAHNNLGTALAESGQAQEAIGQFRQAIEVRPGYVKAYYNLGNALGRQGQLDEAITQFRQAIRLLPDNAILHGSLGNALLRKGQTDEAITQYQEAIRLKPDLALPHNNLGSALLNKGQVEEAIGQIREAIRLDPNLDLAQRNLARALDMRKAAGGQ